MTTKHTHGSNFGRKVADCPRCQELTSGAKPVSWGFRSISESQRQANMIDSIRNHDCKASRCGPVCTYGEW